MPEQAGPSYFSTYSDPEWAAVSRLLPPGCDATATRLALQSLGQNYSFSTFVWGRHDPTPRQIRTLLSDIADALDRTEEGIAAFNAAVAGGADFFPSFCFDDPVDRQTFRRLWATAREAVRSEIQALRDAEPQRGRRPDDLRRDLYVEQVVRIWIGLGGDPSATFVPSDRGQPDRTAGAVIDFLEAATGPVLDATGQPRMTREMLRHLLRAV